jgi:hypothetical protein
MGWTQAMKRLFLMISSWTGQLWNKAWGLLAGNRCKPAYGARNPVKYKGGRAGRSAVLDFQAVAISEIAENENDEIDQRPGAQPTVCGCLAN